MQVVADRQGKITEEDSLQDRLLEKLYGNAMGRLLLKPLITPLFSRIGGAFLGSGLSKFLIRHFICCKAIDMWDYQPKEYASFNDFFTRRLAEGARKVDWAPDVLISPCDGKLSVSKIDSKCAFQVKHTPYTVESLLKDRKLAADYRGGYVWIFRLSVEDYHRYIYADNGCILKYMKIFGKLHTVNPIAGEYFPIYKENTREYCILQSEHFGRMIQMEVGALLVGRIENHPRGSIVRRGWEKGRFAFGGSTVILLTRKGAVCPDPDILENSKKGIETKVRLGEQVGRSF